MTVSEGYKPTVNESETITAAQAVCGVGGRNSGFTAVLACNIERS